MVKRSAGIIPIEGEVLFGRIYRQDGQDCCQKDGCIDTLKKIWRQLIASCRTFRTNTKPERFLLPVCCEPFAGAQ